jgi:hypothetical protein
LPSTAASSDTERKKGQVKKNTARIKREKNTGTGKKSSYKTAKRI